MVRNLFLTSSRFKSGDTLKSRNRRDSHLGNARRDKHWFVETFRNNYSVPRNTLWESPLDPAFFVPGSTLGAVLNFNVHCQQLVTNPICCGEIFRLTCNRSLPDQSFNRSCL